MPRARPTLRDRLERIESRLAETGQRHLVGHLGAIAAAARRRLLGELEALDWEEFGRALRRIRDGAPSTFPGRLEPPEVFPLRRTPEQEAFARRAREAGEALLRAGKVACLTVAGGQATRLRWQGPKGCLAVGPVSHASLFEIHADKVAGAIRRYGAPLPWYLLTSPSNHEATERFFREKEFFGLPPGDVRFFPQGSVPAVDLEGRLLLAAPGALLLSPDGHGGVFAALRAHGILEDARRRGVEHFSYFQVDNPLIPAADPLFLGLHARRGAGMSAKFVGKRAPTEKVGVLVRSEGGIACVEYSDLEPSLAAERDASGDLRLRAGNIASHAIDVAFAAEVPLADLLFHRAEKTVRALGLDGAAFEVRAVKFERFVFDALPRAGEAACLEVDRAEEFSPVKNAEGENSPSTAAAAMAGRAARWFRKAGLPLPPPGPEGYPPIEVSGRFALDEAEFLERARDLRVDPSGPIFLR
ncbi:MAG TPA: UTP--glucose-1-phosphate uridylyltransferase [Planctomycetota bacterium]|jgi:UDP-N-acetylglucosamine/UDP-N-acetylgalactosamine diphosphorylase|nr:UTP--glucose-1-phosphate uridylyltransferase [Planctomycetota bacterium]